ncbi:hypothetical protein C8R42DRAFT_588394, partial [Lentinula raphanica]
MSSIGLGLANGFPAQSSPPLGRSSNVASSTRIPEDQRAGSAGEGRNPPETNNGGRPTLRSPPRERGFSVLEQEQIETPDNPNGNWTPEPIEGVQNPESSQGPLNNPSQRTDRQTGVCAKNTKASIKIAALNIKGHGSTNPDHQNNKWGGIEAMMLRQKISMLIVGEAHLDANRRAEIESRHLELKILYSRLEHTPNAAGVAVVLHKKLANTKGIQIHEIVAGHAMIIESTYHADTKISILAIYAPNRDNTSNAGFWKSISDFFGRNPHIRKPDFMLGDMNMVEEAIDRLPPRMECSSIMDAFDDLKLTLQLEDGWRNTYPTRLEYTFSQERTGYEPRHARLDRIYTKASCAERCSSWEITQTNIKTDHKMVSVRYTSEDAPDIGKGRWVMPAHILYDKEVKEFLQREGLALCQRMEEIEQAEQRDEHLNAQTLWAEFKKEFVRLARQRAKIVIPRIEKEIKDVKTKLNLVCNDPELNETERSISTTLLNEKLRTLLEKRRVSAATKTRAKNHIYKETISRHWTKKNREQKARALIWCLERPRNDARDGGAELNHNPNNEQIDRDYEKTSRGMANMMRNHHESIQEDGTQVNEEQRNETIEKVLDRISTHLPEQTRPSFEQPLTRADVEEALRLSANYKAPGINGISYEVWKVINGRYNNAKAHDQDAFDIVGTLQRVFNDIEHNGLAPGTEFSESWLCPLYKKNDRAKMENYRPISLLNTDYKLMTKALAIKL